MCNVIFDAPLPLEIKKENVISNIMHANNFYKKKKKKYNTNSLETLNGNDLKRGIFCIQMLIRKFKPLGQINSKLNLFIINNGQQPSNYGHDI